MAHRVLNVSVQDDGIHWTLQVLQPEGLYRPEDGDRGHPLVFDADGRINGTIPPLLEMQRWLADLLTNQELKPEKAAELSMRLGKLVEVVGQQIYSALFREQLGARLLTCLEAPSNELLRIELEFSGLRESLLSSWPWEYLFIPEVKGRQHTGQFLAPVTNLVLTRRLFLEGAGPTLLTPKPKVLFVRARPHDLGPVECTMVLDLVRKLRDGNVIDLVEMIEPDREVPRPENWAPTATQKKFQAAVNEHPHIIHFVGHGRMAEEHGQLAFVGGGGETDWCHDFAKLAAADTTQLKLVFLQACESALADPRAVLSDVAHACAQKGVPVVVAMQSKIENLVANEFAVNFYQALVQGKFVDHAFKFALANLPRNAGPLSFGVPVLYLRTSGQLLRPSAPADIARIAVVSQPSREPRCCPRCKEAFIVGKQGNCQNCKLLFQCAKCEARMDTPDPIYNPMNPYCGGCGKKITQKPWRSEKSARDRHFAGPIAGASEPRVDPRIRALGTK